MMPIALFDSPFRYRLSADTMRKASPVTLCGQPVTRRWSS